MLRAVILGLFMGLAGGGQAGFAEQIAGSGLPAPKDKAGWRKAAKLRFQASLGSRLAAEGGGFHDLGGRSLTIRMTVWPDGRIGNAQAVAPAGGVAPEDLAAVLAAVEAMPRLPAFTPEMPPRPIAVTLPLNIE